MRTIFGSPIQVRGEALRAVTDAGTVGQSAVNNVANVHYDSGLLDGDFSIQDAYSTVASLTGLKQGIYLVVANFTIRTFTANQVLDFRIAGANMVSSNQTSVIRSVNAIGSVKPQTVSMQFLAEITGDDSTITLDAQNDPAGTGTIDSSQFCFDAVLLYQVTSDAAYS